MGINAKLRLLILGGEGFIGRNVLPALSEGYECFSVDVRPSIFGIHKGCRFLEVDPYRQKVPDRYDMILHLIDQDVDEERIASYESMLISNTHMAITRRILLFSSAAIYADPSSKYARKKKVLENIYRDFCSRHAIPLTIFRLFNVYGPFQRPGRRGSLIANLFCDYLSNGQTIINDVEVERDFMYAPDIGSFVLKALEKEFDGTTDLGTGKMTSIRELIDIMEREIIKDRLPIVEVRSTTTSKCPHPRNIFQEEVSLTPLVESLKRTYRFYSDHITRIREAS